MAKDTRSTCQGEGEDFCLPDTPAARQMLTKVGITAALLRGTHLCLHFRCDTPGCVRLITFRVDDPHRTLLARLRRRAGFNCWLCGATLRLEQAGTVEECDARFVPDAFVTLDLMNYLKTHGDRWPPPELEAALLRTGPGHSHRMVVDATMTGGPRFRRREP